MTAGVFAEETNFFWRRPQTPFAPVSESDLSLPPIAQGAGREGTPTLCLPATTRILAPRPTCVTASKINLMLAEPKTKEKTMSALVFYYRPP